jgi:hypothetical protein
MRLLITYEKFTFEAPSIWLDAEYVPVVGPQRLFSLADNHGPQCGPYMWLKIAMIDTVYVNANEGYIQWLPAAFRTAWCPLHPFIGIGIVHDKNELFESMTNATSDKSPKWKYITDNDLDELIDRAVGIACRFRDKSLEGKNLYDAIFGWLYAFLLPACPVYDSDHPVLQQSLKGMKELLRAQSDNDNLSAVGQVQRHTPFLSDGNNDPARSTLHVIWSLVQIWHFKLGLVRQQS